MSLAAPTAGLLVLASVSAVFPAPPAVGGPGSRSPMASEVTEETSLATSRPLAPEYRVHVDGSVTQRVCFNWSCTSRQRLTLTAADMTEVARQMALCSGDGLHDRLQRLRIGIWQMEALAEKYEPLLANDEAVNDRDQMLEGRMDCIDNASNTTTYLHVLSDLGLLPGWTLGAPRVRHRFSDLVHWTAVVTDSRDDDSWSVDTWLRPNGHLPFVMPLGDWKSDKVPWDPPFAGWNPTPRYSNQFCGA